MKPARVAIGLAAVVVIIGMSSIQPIRARAAGGGSGDDGAASEPADPTFSAALKNLESNNFAAAIPLLEKVVAAVPRNADAYNYLGYSHRKLGNWDRSFSAYQKALAINPKHRGALEYLGELYLRTGRLELAERQLDKLDDICFFGCAEYTELKNRVAEYKENRPDKAAAKPAAARTMSLNDPAATSP